MPFEPRTSGQRKYLAANSTQADFTTATPVLATGRRGDILVSGGELLVNANANWRVLQLGPYRGGRFQFFGVGSNNGTAAYRIWTVRASLAASGPLPIMNTATLTGGELSSYGTGTLTLGSGTGAAGDIVGATELVADTLTFTKATSATSPSGKATAYETIYGLGTADVYSPADNTTAEITVPDFGNVFGLLIEFGTLSSITSLNCVYELTK